VSKYCECRTSEGDKHDATRLAKTAAKRTTGTNSIPTATETSVIASIAKIRIAIATVATGRRQLAEGAA
jgi:hypothetical protein